MQQITKVSVLLEKIIKASASVNANLRKVYEMFLVRSLLGSPPKWGSLHQPCSVTSALLPKHCLLKCFFSNLRFSNWLASKSNFEALTSGNSIWTAQCFRCWQRVTWESAGFQWVSPFWLYWCWLKWKWPTSGSWVYRTHLVVIFLGHLVLGILLSHCCGKGTSNPGSAVICGNYTFRRVTAVHQPTSLSFAFRESTRGYGSINTVSCTR